jgi:hypothetical protein
MSNTPNPSERGRFSAPRKAATVLRLLRGESLELLSRELDREQGHALRLHPPDCLQQWI